MLLIVRYRYDISHDCNSVRPEMRSHASRYLLDQMDSDKESFSLVVVFEDLPRFSL